MTESYKIYQIHFSPQNDLKAGILNQALKFIEKTHAKEIGKKYFDIDGEECEDNGQCDILTIYKWHKLPSKKWCINELKTHIHALGMQFEGCASDLGTIHIEIAQKLIEKYKL